MALAIIALFALIGLMGMVSVAAWMKTLTSPPLLILLPAITCLVALLSMLVRVDSPLLPALAITMAVAVLSLIAFSMGWMVASFLDERRRNDSQRGGNPDGVEIE